MTKSEKARASRLKHLYGITIEEYDKLLAFQHGKCALCGKLPKTRRLACDHNHQDGKLRGLLCMNCNRTLNDRITIDWIASAFLYMTKSLPEMALGYIPVGRTGRVTSKRRKNDRANNHKKIKRTRASGKGNRAGRRDN